MEEMNKFVFKESSATIGTSRLIELAKAETERDLYADKAEELENQLLELKAKLAEYGKADQWLAENPYFRERLTEWEAKHGLDPQAAEIERLTGENEELRRGMDELGAQVEYWRLKAGVDHEQ